MIQSNVEIIQPSARMIQPHAMIRTNGAVKYKNPASKRRIRPPSPTAPHQRRKTRNGTEFLTGFWQQRPLSFSRVATAPAAIRTHPTRSRRCHRPPALRTHPVILLAVFIIVPARPKSENALQRFRGLDFQRTLSGLDHKPLNQKLFHAFSCALLGQADQMGRIIQ